MDDELTELGSTERRHLRDLAKAWASYGPALREWSSLDGGMQWKLVNGGEYLTRYRQDPESGKKKFTSLGRRSHETELAHADFRKRRDEAKQTVLAGRDEITKAGRVAKAYGLARMPTQTARILRGFWLRSAAPAVAVFGGAALFAYELEAGVLAPSRVLEDESLVLFPLAPGLTAEQMAVAYTATTGEDASTTKRRGRTIFQTPGWPAMEVWQPEFLLDRLEDRDQQDVLRAALTYAPVKGFTVARDGQPVEFNTLDVRAYALAARVMADEPDDAWGDRAHCAMALAHRMGLEFDADQVAAFPDLVTDASPESPRF